MNIWEVIATVITIILAVVLVILLLARLGEHLERKRKLLELRIDYYQRQLRDKTYITPDQTGMAKINRLATVMAKLERLDGESYEGLSERLKLFAKEIVATTEKHMDIADKG